MRTLGIDLAAQFKSTAICAIEWTEDGATVEPPERGRSKEHVIAAMRRADWIGIDAPLGWPVDMVAAVASYAETGTWPRDAKPESLRYRLTDWSVVSLTRDLSPTVWPLSVSSDRIAACAWVCAALLSEFAALTGRHPDRLRTMLTTTDPPGPGPDAQGIVEVYPAAALAMWGMTHTGYKKSSRSTDTTPLQKREAILDALGRATSSWLTIGDDVRAACLENDDALDALIASLVTRSAALGQTARPHPDELEVVRREGWIHVPNQSGLDDLGPARNTATD